jgi:hypothetical protein
MLNFGFTCSYDENLLGALCKRPKTEKDVIMRTLQWNVIVLKFMFVFDKTKVVMH